MIGGRRIRDQRIEMSIVFLFDGTGDRFPLGMAIVFLNLCASVARYRSEVGTNGKDRVRRVASFGRTDCFMSSERVKAAEISAQCKPECRPCHMGRQIVHLPGRYEPVGQRAGSVGTKAGLRLLRANSD